jgi:hypothetical protein
MPDDKERATEMEWLKFFYTWVDLGPGEGDARAGVKEFFTKKTGKALPVGYDCEE